MNSSAMLHPTIERFILDEDCIFLLCSDGLSDNDRVEEYWQTILLPVLEGKADLAKAAQQWVAIANEQNGHDNVTVGLVYCRVFPNAPNASTPVPASIATVPAVEYASTVLSAAAPTASNLKTHNLKPLERSQARSSVFLLGLLLIAGFIGLVVAFLTGGLGFLTGEVANTPPSTSPEPAVSVPVPPILSPSPNLTTSAFAVGTRLLVNRSTPAGEATPITLLPNPSRSPDPDTTRSIVPIGSVLEVISQQQTGLDQLWLGVKVCSLAQPSPAHRSTVPQRIAQPGELGWVPEAAIAPFVTVNVSLTQAQLGTCGNERKVSSEGNP